MSKKILFVDDEHDWRLVPVIFLQEAGYEVLTAKDTIETLAQAEKTKLDLVILDVNLGGENGLELMKALKRNHPDLPVMLYTGAEHDAEAVQAMLKAGARQYLRKGMMDELVAAVGSALNYIATDQ